MYLRDSTNRLLQFPFPWSLKGRREKHLNCGKSNPATKGYLDEKDFLTTLNCFILFLAALFSLNEKHWVRPILSFFPCFCTIRLSSALKLVLTLLSSKAQVPSRVTAIKRFPSWEGCQNKLLEVPPPKTFRNPPETDELDLAPMSYFKYIIFPL